MADFDLAIIEQKMKDAIHGLNRSYIAEIATYGGEFDDLESLSQAVRRFPAVWVTFAGGVPKPLSTSHRKWKFDLTFVVLVGARSIRNEESTRHGVVDGSTIIEAGTFQLLRDVIKALSGKDLSLPIDKFAPGRISTVFNTRIQKQAVSVLAQEYKTGLVVHLDDDSDAPDLLSIGLNYHLPGVAENPIVTDVIPLEQ